MTALLRWSAQPSVWPGWRERLAEGVSSPSLSSDTPGRAGRVPVVDMVAAAPDPAHHVEYLAGKLSGLDPGGAEEDFQWGSWTGSVAVSPARNDQRI